MMSMYASPGRNRNVYGTVRSMVPSRATPLASAMEEMMYTAPYFYHIPPPQPLNTYPGRKRRKRVSAPVLDLPVSVTSVIDATTYIKN